VLARSTFTELFLLVLLNRKWTFDFMCICSFYLKIIFKMLKYFLENICMYVSTFYVLTQSFVKNGYFHGLSKKDKSHAANILVPIFIIFTYTT
jgi:hypothetical protein